MDSYQKDVKALTEAVVNSVEDLKYLAKREEIHRFRNEVFILFIKKKKLTIERENFIVLVSFFLLLRMKKKKIFIAFLLDRLVTGFGS